MLGREAYGCGNGIGSVHAYLETHHTSAHHKHLLASAPFAIGAGAAVNAFRVPVPAEGGQCAVWRPILRNESR